MGITKVKWVKRVHFIEMPADSRVSFTWTEPVRIGSHVVGVCEEDESIYIFLTIEDKRVIDATEKYIAVIDTFSPGKSGAPLNLSVGQHVAIANDEIFGTTSIRTS